MYDLMLESNASALLMLPFYNYAAGNHDAIYEMMTHPAAVSGLSDGGAHCGLICDASYPTFLLTHWARDRRRGPKFSLEYVVRKQTMDTATLFGLSDRGVIAVGKKADLIVIDPHTRSAADGVRLACGRPQADPGRQGVRGDGGQRSGDPAPRGRHRREAWAVDPWRAVVSSAGRHGARFRARSD
jgi:N-acyl-D-aspartate/D-glutamate deacylase